MRKIFVRLMLLLAAALIIPEALSMLHNLRAFTVMSGSMEPSIRTGSIIITDTTKTEPKAGDVITFEAGGTSVTHRVLRIDESGNYITKGDHNPSEDPSPVDREQIMGTVIIAIPFLGMMIMMLRRPSAICLLISLIIFTRAKERFTHEKEQKNSLHLCGRSGCGGRHDHRDHGISDGL